MNPNECCFKYISCIRVSISATRGTLLVPSTLNIRYRWPAGGNLVSDASNFPQGAGCSWSTASPLHFSFTWHYSAVEAISCSQGPWTSLTHCHLTSWLQNLISRQQSILACVSTDPVRSCCGDNMQSSALKNWSWQTIRYNFIPEKCINAVLLLQCWMLNENTKTDSRYCTE